MEHSEDAALEAARLADAMSGRGVMDTRFGLRFSAHCGEFGRRWLLVLPIFLESHLDVSTFRPRLNVVVEKDD